MPWDPNRYEQFKKERYAPFNDLVALIEVRPGLRVLDLGCGTGELTRRLADALPESEVLGVDASAPMLARSEEFTRPGLRFERRSIEDVSGEWDVVFSNAALQWVGDHASLFPRLFSMVTAGGQLAVQMPSNFDHPTHTLLDQIADEAPFREALAGITRWSRSRPVLGIERYAEILYGCGGADVVALEKVYPHVLESADALVDWMSGTALVPFMELLEDELKDSFLERYRTLLRERFPGSPVFYGFKRTLVSARRR